MRFLLELFCQEPDLDRRYSHFFSRLFLFHDSTRIHPSPARLLLPNATSMTRTKQIQPTKGVVGRAPQHPQHPEHLTAAVTAKTAPSAGYGVKKPHRWRPAGMAVSALASIPATLRRPESIFTVRFSEDSAFACPHVTDTLTSSSLHPIFSASRDPDVPEVHRAADPQAALPAAGARDRAKLH